MQAGTAGMIDFVGYLASALVLATFCLKDMASLRACAIASNLAFIAFGYLAGIHPVLALHLVLLPTNLVRLAQLSRTRASRVRGGPESLPLPGTGSGRP
jgi:hypothetical protein